MELSDSDEDDDDDEEDEEEDDDEELEGGEVDVFADDAPAGEAADTSSDASQHGPPSTPVAPPPPPPPAAPGPPTPIGQSDPTAQQQQQQTPQPAPQLQDAAAAADGSKADGTSSRTDSPAVQAARERKRTAAQARPKDDRPPPKHGLVNGKGKVKHGKPQLVGGATAPTPVALQATDMQIEEGSE